ncbi:DNA invertase Pin-like site-specific DNA recombinase [Ruminiclostridium sufflavum DSM 19573]|uniref:DNA invertase Pin-like site-specific DNA recombinase n=1 Tax=Ruminiclostridium sufflavum DSM 19573 TaxID=1121337 RepID=A0A318XL82_9FIRM|nr:recombinase family protein [Ruminiclostridium sufflavum]PYG88283.1 DNA invertase Pin-like site-specific DNA recombinase [Ruminiclostridium sufflavum DSM 19573]
MIKAGTKKIRAAAYCRVSTEKDEQLLSLRTQKEFFEEYADKMGYELVGLYADEGISGTKLKNRKQFNRMMQDAERGLFDRVYVKDVSRLARNVVDFLQSIRRLKALNIDCQFVTANMSANDGELTLTILAAVAQEESSNLSKRVKFGKSKNAEKGRVPNLVYGYDKEIGNYFDLRVNPFEADVVRRIFDLYINGGYGANKIANILNKEFIRTKRNCNWSQLAICRILKNQIYIGKVINGKEQVEDFLTGKRIKTSIEEQHIADKPELAIISKPDFEKAQLLLKTRIDAFKAGEQRHSNKFPFSTLIKCGCCGRSFRRISREWTSSTYIKWVCSKRNIDGAGACNNDTLVDEKDLLDEIKDYLSKVITSKEKLFEKTINEFKRKYKLGFDEFDEKQLEEELSRLKKAKDKQTKMYEADIITIEELKERTSDLNIAIRKIENELSAIKGNTSTFDRLETIVKKYCGNVNDVLSTENLDNAMLKKVIDKIVVSGDGKIRVYLRLFKELELDL